MVASVYSRRLWPTAIIVARRLLSFLVLDVVEWFKSRITDVKTHSTCPQLLSSAAENKIGVPFAMMTAIGELQPPLAEHNLNVSHLLRNIRPLLLEADAVISSLTSPLPSTNTNIGTVLR